MRVSQYLDEQQIPYETLVHPPAFTAQKRAKTLRLPGQRVAKSVLLAGPSGYFLAILPASRQIDLEKLARILDGPVRLADAEEVARVFRDCEWGVVAPFGRLYGLRTFLDESLTGVESIVLEGMSHFEAIRLSSRDFERLERPFRVRFAR